MSYINPNKSLPKRFCPDDGTLGRVNTIVRTHMPTPIQTTSRSYRSNNSGWDSFNDGVASIGSWLQEIGAFVIALIITAIPTLVAAFMMLKWNIQAFGDGFGWGILSLFADLFIVGIGYYAFMLVFGIIYAILYMVGYVFYNAYTLIIAIILGLGIWAWVSFVNGQSYNSNKNMSNNTTVTAPAYTEYRCAATKLNVRSDPSVNARIVGSLSRGETIYVYGVDGDFARIEWNDGIAYVSNKYISR
ncbi:MAG: SH3 domain-containing protein [Bacteroidales bacterium]|nr:SH3 domain-containing protein [Bacteroidales bacterium]